MAIVVSSQRRDRIVFLNELGANDVVDFHEQNIPYPSNDTEFVFNNMRFEEYGTAGCDRAVFSGIMQIVTSHEWCLLNYEKFPVEQSLGVKLDSLADSQRLDGAMRRLSNQLRPSRANLASFHSEKELVASEDFGPTAPSVSCQLKGGC